MLLPFHDLHIYIYLSTYSASSVKADCTNPILVSIFQDGDCVCAVAVPHTDVRCFANLPCGY